MKKSMLYGLSVLIILVVAGVFSLLQTGTEDAFAGEVKKCSDIPGCSCITQNGTTGCLYTGEGESNCSGNWCALE